MTTKPTKEELIVMADSGKTFYGMSWKYDVPSSKVRDWFIEYNLLSICKYIPVSKEELNFLYTTKKMSQKQIGQEIGISGTSISRMLRKFGISTRTRGPNRRQSYRLSGHSITLSSGGTQ